MDELRNTPERTPATDVDKGIEASSPVKPLQPATSGHKAEEVAQRQMPTALQDTLVGAMWNLLEKTEEIMDEAFPKLPRMPEVQGSDSYAIYLNILSDIVHKGLDEVSGKPSEEAIHFFDTHNIAPKNHPTGTTSRPDFLAIKIRTDDPPPLEFEWSALEATGEVLSGSDKEKSRAKTAAYTSYLLQARPDRVTVQGIYVDPSSFRLIVSNACGAFVTDTLDWKSRPYRLLLCAWIWRLYEPIVDPSITANIEQDKPPTFNITIPGLPETVYRDCTIYSTGTAFGRRTIVLSCPNPEIVIKEQYVETSRRFEEGPTLAKIHGNGTFPGVVRPGWHGSVGSSKEGGLVVESEESQRKKTRVILLDKAPSIMDAKTPREALVAMYDLLEITRFLHKKRKILHRDISASNVRIRDVVPPDTSSADNDLLAPVVPANTSAGNDLLAPVVPANTSSVNKDLPPAAAPAKQSIVEELQEMCFASYLLRTKCNSSPGRLDTRVLLIDFDMSEDQEPGNQGDDKNAPQARTVRQYPDMR